MIYLQNLHKQFGSKIILKNANFHLRPSERVGLVGENGTGKETRKQNWNPEHVQLAL